MIQVVVNGVPSSSVLVRIPTSPAGPAFTLPAAPPGHTVTATVGRGAAEAVVRELQRAGYRLAGEIPGSPSTAIDLLVPARARTACAGWWSELVVQAERVFDLRMGPVAAVLDDELALHALALDR